MTQHRRRSLLCFFSRINREVLQVVTTISIEYYTCQTGVCTVQLQAHAHTQLSFGFFTVGAPHLSNLEGQSSRASLAGPLSARKKKGRKERHTWAPETRARYESDFSTHTQV